MPSDPLKVCPSCKQKDFTNFSRCRFCGTSYDAKIVKSSGLNLDERVIAGLLGAIVLIGAVFYFQTFMKTERAKKLGPLAKSIQMAKRPRLIEFYAPWCGACRSYEPVIEQCRAKYAWKMDFQRVNIDDPSSLELKRTFGVSAIPRTYIFNNKGEQMADILGCIPYEELEKHVQNPRLYQ